MRRRGAKSSGKASSTGRKRKRNGRDGFNGSTAAGESRAGIMQSGFVVKSKPLFGYKATRTIQYYSPGTVTSGAGSAGAYVFSGNGAFDPDITGTGGQPMGFDQMMLYFNHYTVIRTRLRVVFQTNSTTLRATVAVMISGSSTVTSVIENAMENGDIAFQVLEYAGAMGGTATFTRTLNHGKFQGLRNLVDDPNMRGDAASNPTEQTYFHLMIWNPSSATTVSADFQVMLEYDTIFHEPRKSTLSLVGLPLPRKVAEKEEKECLAVGLDEKVDSCSSIRQELAIEDDYDQCCDLLGKLAPYDRATWMDVQRQARSRAGLGDLTLEQRRRIIDRRAPNLEGS